MFYNDPLEISVHMWIKILIDKNITTELDLNILRIVYESKNHEINASQIAPKLNLQHHGPINLQISKYSKRIVRKTGVQPPLRKEGKPRWWHVLFLGYEKEGRFPWIMRPELAIAFEEVFGEGDTEFIYSDETTFEEVPSLSEGSVSQIFVNRYERSRDARTKCIAHYGCRCTVCGFDFKKTYGQIGKGKIHIHHLIPLSEIKKEYTVDPINDLRPVCPNCHLMIHSRREPFSVEEVRKLIKMEDLRRAGN